MSLLKRADAVVVTSENLLEGSVVLAGFRSKCHIIPHGIDLERFKTTPELEARSREIKAKTNLPIVLFVGRLVYYKGLEYLIQAMQGIEAELVIVGSGPLESKLRRLAVIRGVKDKIEWRGKSRTMSLRPITWLMICWFCLPAKTARPLAWLSLEAQAFARPVISTNLPTGISFINRHQGDRPGCSSGRCLCLAGGDSDPAWLQKVAL